MFFFYMPQPIIVPLHCIMNAFFYMHQSGRATQRLNTRGNSKQGHAPHVQLKNALQNFYQMTCGQRGKQAASGCHVPTLLT